MAVSQSIQVETKVNMFSFNMSEIISRETTGNMVFSPFSIYTTLAMLCIGAGGKTKKEIVDALGWDGGKDLSPFLESLELLYAGLVRQKSTLSIANKFWVGQNTKIHKDYRSGLVKYFDVEISHADFSRPKLARGEINKWVAEKTHDKIKELFPPDSISDTTALVLANALYFKGQWEKKFDKGETSVNDFFVSKDETVKSEFMFLNDKFAMAYDEKHKLQLLELPYAGGEFSMVFVIPTAEYDDRGQMADFKDLSDALSSIEDKAKAFQGWMLQLADNGKDSVEIHIPKFKIKLGMDLITQLKLLGIHEAFEPEVADLSSMTEDKSNLYVSSAFHKSFIAVDEEGTTAAAATGMGVNFKSLPMMVSLNHPFLFYIIHKNSNAIIFSGKVHNPLKD